MGNKPDEGALDPLRDLRWEDIDREVAEDEDSEYEVPSLAEIQLRKEKGLRQTGKRN